MSPSETLERELRAAKPVAPAALQEGVRTVAAQEPERESFLQRLSLRRFVLVAAPATVAAALIAAGVIGLTGDRPRNEEFAVLGEPAVTSKAIPDAPTREAAPAQEDSAAPPSA